MEGRCLDVLAANPLATALSPRLTAGANRLRDVFLDPEEQAMFLNREKYLVSGTDGIMLVVYHPDAGSEDEHKLALLGSAALAPADDAFRSGSSVASG